MLVREPYYLTIEQLYDLTPFQAKRLYFRSEELNRASEPAKKSPRTAWMESLRKQGKSPAEIEKILAEAEKQGEVIRQQTAKAQTSHISELMRPEGAVEVPFTPPN